MLPPTPIKACAGTLKKRSGSKIIDQTNILPKVVKLLFSDM